MTLQTDRNAPAKAEVSVISGGAEALAPAAIEQKAEDLGVSKTQMPFKRCFVLSVMAGAFISLGAMFFCLVVGDPALPFAAQRVLGGCLFSTGLMLVVVCGAELFTGNTMIVMTALSKRIRWGAVLKNWCIVFLGNLVGALVVVGCVYLANFQAMNGGIVGETVVSVAYGKMTGDWSALFFKGVMCNFLVCLGVWVAYAARSVADKVLGVMLPICAFVACGFEHCVANMFFMPLGALLSATGWTVAGVDPSLMDVAGMLWNWSATVPGNVVGGALFVGVMYWLAFHKKDSGKDA